MYKNISVMVTTGICALLVLASWSPPSAAARDRLDVHTTQGISYVSGGVGIGERNTLRAITGDYSLQLGFAQTSGSYLSGVDVEIQDAGGSPIVQAQSHGPWFFADLPTGTYTVRATTLGNTQQKVIRVADNRQKTLYFHW